MINKHKGLHRFKSQLTVQSIRRLNAGKCVDKNDNSRIFKEDNDYSIRLKFVTNKKYIYSLTSHALNITTNSLPSDGWCVIQNIDNLFPLEPFNLFCDNWKNQENLEFNALINNVYMNKTHYVNNARKLTSIAPVGNVSITVLIKKKYQLNTITCYQIIGQFKSISETINAKLNLQNITNSTVPANQTSVIINEILEDVSTLTNTTSLSENPDVAISIVTVVEDIFENNLTTKNEAALIVDNVVDNIIGSSGVLDIVNNVKNNSDNISWVVLEGDDIITELTTLTSITSNEDIIHVETTTAVLVDRYLPEIFEAIDIFIDVQTTLIQNNETNVSSKQQSSVIQDQLYVIAQQSQSLIENLESTLEATLAVVKANNNDTVSNNNEVINSFNTLAESLVEYATLSASKALSQSSVGESFNYETIEYNDDGTIQNKKVISATKFDANLIDFDNINTNNETNITIQLPKCGTSQQNIQLPISFMKVMKQKMGTFDCAFMSSTRNNFVPKNNKNTNRTQNSSDIISINLYDENGEKNKYESDTCFPYLITMTLNEYTTFNLNNISLNKIQESFPRCDFWNVNKSFWSSDGCFVYDLKNETVTCGCTHLTSFSLSTNRIIPEATVLTELDWRRLNIKNLLKYPVVWITVLTVLILFTIICYVNPRSGKINTKSIIAFQDIIYKSVQDDKLWKDVFGKEIKYISNYMQQHLLGNGIMNIAATKNGKKSLCALSYKLFKVYLRNDHTLLSVFQRTGGTNFSSKQRLGCFFLYVSTIMVCTGMFYGLDQSTPIQDTFASFTISLCGTLPVLITKKLFEKSKPIQVFHNKKKHSLVNTLDLEDILDENEFDDEKETQIETTTISTSNFDIEELTKKSDLTMGMFSKEIEKLYENNEENKIIAISQIRKVLFESMFPLPYKCKNIAWIIIIIWSITACITAIVYGLSFDIKYSKITTKNDPCFDTSMKIQIESLLSEEWFEQKQMERNLENKNSYGGGDSISWLLSLLQSLITSFILWQPLTVYIITWMKIWMFTWHLKMKIGPSNIILLCKRCCCGHNDGIVHDNDDNDVMNNMLSLVTSKTTTHNRKASQIVAHSERPLDIISFLAHKEWIIDDTIANETQTNDNISMEMTQIKHSENKIMRHMQDEMDYVKETKNNLSVTGENDYETSTSQYDI